jgi:hypothetical protein
MDTKKKKTGLQDFTRKRNSPQRDPYKKLFRGGLRALVHQHQGALVPSANLLLRFQPRAGMNR